MKDIMNEFTTVQMEHFSYWREHTLWHWEFWVLLFLAVAPWVVWFIIRKRGSEARLLLSGAFAVIVASWFDFLGIAFGLWEYKAMLIPTIPSFMPWDISVVPVSIMIWLQFKPRMNPFIKAFSFSVIASFIGEPIFIWIGLYNPIHWSHLYSFPIYILIYLLAYKISKTDSTDLL
ncbi:CBO0543 family protein [Bacillus suaedae]|uniref:Uncharacterized protein n=1 Tax=Halalkalibacter suaedae TaxID=2822140 RepID=A0A941ATF0_9BACI|nr:CBO0543 family protein [Bacillus suaedae]MBP3951569.1 hypothetical protein [Bacillus suaedae]